MARAARSLAVITRPPLRSQTSISWIFMPAPACGKAPFLGYTPLGGGNLRDAGRLESEAASWPLLCGVGKLASSRIMVIDTSCRPHLLETRFGWMRGLELRCICSISSPALPEIEILTNDRKIKLLVRVPNA